MGSSTMINKLVSSAKSLIVYGQTFNAYGLAWNLCVFCLRNFVAVLLEMQHFLRIHDLLFEVPDKAAPWDNIGTVHTIYEVNRKWSVMALNDINEHQQTTLAQYVN